MSSTPLPPWLAAPVAPGARPGAVAAALATLQSRRTLWLVGPPGSGVTAVAAGVADAWPGPVLAARLTACRTPSDVVLSVGEAVGALPPGDEGAVAAALRGAGEVLIVLDDADIPELGDAHEQMAALASSAHWLCTGTRAPAQVDCQALPPIEGVAPVGLPQGVAMPAKAELLAIVGASLPGAMGLPESLVIPCGDGREALRRSAAAALRSRGELEPSRVAASALPDVEALLGLATGAPLRARFRSDDAMVLRWLGEVLADPDASCRASAAAARLLAALGQPAIAHGVLDAAERRNARARPAARALVCWARGDLHAARGDLAAAERAWLQASDLLERARDPVVLAAMLRRQAEALAARSEAPKAAARYRAARALHLRLEDPAGVAATVRGTADLAVSAGEVLSAEMLYDEADGTQAGIVEASNRRIGRAGLALAQGDLARARHLLADTEFEAVSVPLLAANRARRLAELALREGRHADAQEAAEHAARAYAALGEGVAQGHTTRLAGDIAAAAGQLTEAATWWQRAIELQVRVRDVAGLRRTLRHAAALEQEAGSSAVATELRDAVAALADPGQLDGSLQDTGDITRSASLGTGDLETAELEGLG